MNGTESYISRAELWMLITIFFYFLMNGAQIFETLVWVPKWTANPPESLRFLTNMHGMSLKTFWILIHSLHEVTFLVAMVFCWKLLPIRNALLILFALHLAVRIWTLCYFAPLIIEFQGLAETAANKEDLLKQVDIWRKLNFVRVGIYLLISIALVPVFVKLTNLK